MIHRNDKKILGFSMLSMLNAIYEHVAFAGCFLNA